MNANVGQSQVAQPKKRGRPRKLPVIEEVKDDGHVKRKRGRPRKVPLPNVEVKELIPLIGTSLVKRFNMFRD